MNRVLLLMTTTTYKAAAFLEAAEKLGVRVVVGSDRTQVFAAANPAGHLTLSFLDPAESALSIVAFAREHPLRAVIAADDDGVILAATAAKDLGLRHNSVESVGAARNKHTMREVLAGTSLNSPQFACFPLDVDPADAARAVPFPCVAKPLFLSASRGVIRADNSAQLGAAFSRIATILERSGASASGASPPVVSAPHVIEPDALATSVIEPGVPATHVREPGASRPGVSPPGGSSSRQVLVEEFIPGIEVALEGLLSNGVLRVLALFDKPDPLDGPFFEETLYITPSRLPAGVQDAIAGATQRAVSALGLSEGPIHAELRVNERGPWILEIHPRSIGGLCARTLRFGTGVSLEELILRNALGLEGATLEREARAAGVMMIPVPRAGILRGIAGQVEAGQVPSIEEIRLTIPVGQRVAPPPEGSRYLGFIFARSAKPETVETALREAHGRLHFTIDS